MSDTIIVPFFPSETVFLVCPLISFFSCLVALIASLSLGLYKDSLGLMSFWIILADLFFNFPKLIACFPYEKSLGFCNTMLAFSHMGMVSSFFWSAFFAHLLFRVSKTHNVNVSKRYMQLYFLFAVFVPLLHTIASMFSDYVQYDQNTRSCIHKMKFGQIDYGYVFYTQIPLVIAILMSLCWYMGTIRELRRLFEERNNLDLLTLILYPAILIVCWTPPMVTSTLTFIGIRPSTQLVAAFQGLAQLQGFFDVLVYGRSKNFFKLICTGFTKRRALENLEGDSFNLEGDSVNTEEELSRALLHRSSRFTK